MIIYYFFIIFLTVSATVVVLNDSKTSTGIANITVFDLSPDKSFIVANVLKCIAPGIVDKISAASANF